VPVVPGNMFLIIPSGPRIKKCKRKLLETWAPVYLLKNILKISFSLYLSSLFYICSIMSVTRKPVFLMLQKNVKKKKTKEKEKEYWWPTI